MRISIALGSLPTVVILGSLAFGPDNIAVSVLPDASGAAAAPDDREEQEVKEPPVKVEMVQPLHRRVPA